MSTGFDPSALHAGRGTTLFDSPQGRAIAARGARPWRHPWFVHPAWQPEARRWFATVKPGFVNGRCPSRRTTLAEQAEFGRDFGPGSGASPFGLNPLTGRPFFSDFVFDQSAAPSPAGPIEIPLYLEPAIGLPWRALGFDAFDDSAVPQFFLDRGAAEKPKQASGEDGLPSLSILDAQPAPQGLRLLRACDVWIHQPRLALTSSIDLHPGPATGISNVSQTLSLRSAPPGDVLRVMSGTLRPAEGIDPLARVYEEPNYDELLIATVFLLSPPGLEPQAEPDGSWRPFVRHHLFWNLNYTTPWFRQYGGDPAIPFLPPLAGGAAMLVTNYLVASVNDILQDALNLVTAHSMAGTFYTPTCGGHDATFPESKGEESKVQGLDKRTRLRANAAAAARRRRAAKLDPAYPFRAEAFDPALLKQTV